MMFLNLFDCIINACDEISKWDDTDISNKAQTLKVSILQSEFIIGLLVLVISKRFRFGFLLSTKLQKTIYFKMVINLTQDTLNEIESFKENAITEFRSIYLKATEIVKKFELPLILSRVFKIQRNRNNEKLIILNNIFVQLYLFHIMTLL